MANVEILSIGNELLIGKIQNTNASWMAKRLTTLGANLRRITTVSDDVDEISMAVNEVLEREPDFLITTGGLGPTFDDKTLEGVARALNVLVDVNEEAFAMVEEKYKTYASERGLRKIELTRARLKMARLPKGAEPLSNSVGTAPGVLIKHGKTTIVSLPGVPPEMESIFENSVKPLLKKLVGKATFFETSLGLSGLMESELAPIIDKVMHDNPYVYIKSHPRGRESTPQIELHLSTTSKRIATAKSLVNRSATQITEAIRARGGKVTRFETK
jgi:molybdenum cofactor synthesis domain-containing protein